MRSAILRARSMADSEGLQTIGVFGKTVLGFGWSKCLIMSKITELVLVVVWLTSAVLLLLNLTNSISSSSSETVFLWVGLRVSKQTIPSKQSSSPSLLSASAAWTLSAFVKIYIFCTQHKKKCHKKTVYQTGVLGIFLFLW